MVDFAGKRDLEETLNFLVVLLLIRNDLERIDFGGSPPPKKGVEHCHSYIAERVHVSPCSGSIMENVPHNKKRVEKMREEKNRKIRLESTGLEHVRRSNLFISLLFYLGCLCNIVVGYVICTCM